MRLPCALVVCAALATAATAAPAAAATPASTSTKYTLVTEPTDQYRQIYALIGSATSTLDMTMYELTDTTAEQDLAAAAGKGVTVRVLLDQNREKSNNTAAYTYLSGHGVQVEWAPSTYEATHQKTITVDGDESAIMSGNLTSQYYSTSRDFDVLDTNQVDVGAVEKVFAADWADKAITPGDGDNLTWSPTDAQASLLAVIDSARTSLQIENEEMADTAVTDAIAAAAKRGVDVQVTMTANSDYDSDFDDIVAAGGHVSTYPDDETSLYIHAKVIVADGAESDHNAYVGSINFSDASMNHNRELGFLTADDAIVGGLASTLTSDFAGATRYTG